MIFDLIQYIQELEIENKDLKRELECARIVNKQHRKLNGALRREYEPKVNSCDAYKRLAESEIKQKNKYKDKLEKIKEYIRSKITITDDDIYLYLNECEI